MTTFAGCDLPGAERAVTPAYDLTASKTLPPTPSATRKPTSTATPTVTPIPTLPASTPAYLGTTIPADTETISRDNIQNLTFLAQWGRGMIQGVAFSPDGSQFVVGSAFGLAVYDIHDMRSAPAWIPLAIPTDYYNLAFSQDGNYLRLSTGEDEFMILEFPAGKAAVAPPALIWMTTNTHSHTWGEMDFLSTDGKKQFKSHSGPPKATPDWENTSIYDLVEEISIREVYAAGTGELLYKLPDENFYVRYNDVNQPEGCDLFVFSPCGNALMPSTFHPYEAAFSPSGDTLSVLYRAPNYGNTNRFSVIRVYDADNGKFLEQIGSLQQPVQTFTYEPNGYRLLVGFVDGSIHIWDIESNESALDAWHFNEYLAYAEFSGDGRWLLLKRPGMLEVRSIKDGSLRARYDAVAYALSPVDGNIIAIADKNNVIKIIELDSGRGRMSIPAHDYPIFTVAFSPDGRYIASSGQDCLIKMWDVYTGELDHYFEATSANAYSGGPPLEDETDGNSRIFIYSIKFIEGTDQVLGFGSWGTVVSWDIDSGATNYVVYSAPLEFYGGMMTIKPHYPESFSVDIDKQLFYINSQSYDLKTGKILGEYDYARSAPDDCAESGPVTMDGRVMFTFGYENRIGQVCVIDTRDASLIHIIPVIPNPSYQFEVAGFFLSPDGKSLIVATTMGTVNVYRISN